MAKDPLGDAITDSTEALRKAFGELGSMLGEYRVEITWGVLAAIVYSAFVLAFAEPIEGGVAFWLLLVILRGIGHKMEKVNPQWRLLRRSLDYARVRRHWERALEHCGFQHPIPITRLERVPAGYRARVQVGRGIAFKDIEMRKEPLSASMQLRTIDIERDSHNAATGTLIFVNRDHLADVAGTAWSGAEPVDQPRRGPGVRFHRPDGRPPRSWNVKPKKPRSPRGGGGATLWDPIPIGTGSNGDVPVSLPYRNVLFGGIPDSGKSAAMSMFLARAALDASTDLYLIDGKEVDLAVWEGCAKESAYTIEEAIALLDIVQRRLTERLQALRRANLRKVAQDGKWPFILVCIDELALFTANLDTKLAKEFTVLLTDLLARGRAAGVIVLAATQKPEGSVVSTNLRDLFAYRLAFRCSTPEASDTILGRGWAAQGFNAQTIPPKNPGVCYLLDERGIPERIRTHYLNDDDVRAYAARAYEGRQHDAFPVWS